MSNTARGFNYKAGIIASLVGGLVMSIPMGMMGTFPGIASMMGSDSAFVGFIVHMVISLTFGIGFAVFAGLVKMNTVALGAIFGIIIWIIGPMLLMPVLMGDAGAACGAASSTACGDASKSACGDASKSACGDASKSACGDASKSACGDASKSACGTAVATSGNACSAGGSMAMWLSIGNHLLYGLITGVAFKWANRNATA
jgi:hypothetical protein